VSVYRDFLDALELRGSRVQRAGAKASAQCLAHEDDHESLSVLEGDDGRVLVHCHAGCQVREVLAAAGWEMRDLFSASGSNRHREIVATYDYRDESGELLYQVVRFRPKDFRQRRPDGVGGWDWRLAGGRRVLYRLPEVIEAAGAGRRVWIVEGEKDVHALESAGEAATCNPGGAGKWRKEYSQPLHGARVTIIADRDEPGRRHARRVAESLEGVASEVAIVEAAEGKDAADHLAAGRSLADLVPVTVAEDQGIRVVVRFLSPDELRASAPSEPPWRWHGYVATGALTVLAGKPKAGKSTLSLALGHAICVRAPTFLGHPIDGGPVVYVSEEGTATLAHKLLNGDLRIATRETVWPRPAWPALVEAARGEASRVGACLLVIDTFAFWAGLPPEAEKDAGAMQSAMEPLIAGATTGLAVLLVVHARKGGGEDGEAVRGSSALAGAADIVLELERVGSDSPRQRKLLALSRYPQTPAVLVVEHDPGLGAWSVVGEGTDRADARDIASRRALLDTLEYDADLTRAELEEATGKKSREWHSTLEKLIDDGLVARSGAGKKGDAYRYRKLRAGCCAESAQNGVAMGFDAAAHPVGAQHQNYDAAESADGAGPAETAPDRNADAELERVAAKFPDLDEDDW
jgi:5S rRNA maturation endonuclease (ribonuclease M5)